MNVGNKGYEVYKYEQQDLQDSNINFKDKNEKTQTVVAIAKGRKVAIVDGQKTEGSLIAKLKDVLFKIFGIQHSHKDVGIIVKDDAGLLKFKQLASLGEDEKAELGIDRLTLSKASFQQITAAIVSAPKKKAMLDSLKNFIEILKFPHDLHHPKGAINKVRTFIEHIDMTASEFNTQLENSLQYLTPEPELKTLNAILKFVDQIQDKARTGKDSENYLGDADTFGFSFSVNENGKRTLHIENMNLHFPLK